jgi:hypothetical protein
MMATVTTQLNRECSRDAHTEHLCYMMSQGFHLTNEREYKALVEEPKYRCKHCGRTAKSNANLCEPVPL